MSPISEGNTQRVARIVMIIDVGVYSVNVKQISVDFRLRYLFTISRNSLLRNLGSLANIICSLKSNTVAKNDSCRFT